MWSNRTLVAIAASITVGTEGDWTEDPLTHNAYMAFYTTSEGDLSER